MSDVYTQADADKRIRFVWQRGSSWFKVARIGAVHVWTRWFYIRLGRDPFPTDDGWPQ